MGKISERIGVSRFYIALIDALIKKKSDGLTHKEIRKVYENIRNEIKQDNQLHPGQSE